MKKHFVIYYLFLLTFICCSKSENYIPINDNNIESNLENTPLPKLSNYGFFKGDLKKFIPVVGVIPYEPASSLFNDYAHKKRFVWLPKNKQATYNGDDNVFNFPINTVFIKTFFYENVLPNNDTKIIETRLLVNKTSGWKAYDYIWNDDQTDAFLEATGNGITIPINWNENGVIKTVSYKTPSQTECLTCHKISINGISTTIPIGPKPQNLNTLLNYNDGSINQITKWKAEGLLGSDTPAIIKSTVNWEDVSKSLELRARSYLDINCAHCHRQGGHCDYVAQRFNFSNSNLNTFGVCLTKTLATIPNSTYIINSGVADNSNLIIRMNTVNQATRMPYLGRTTIHEEGVQLVRDWINSMPKICQ